MSFADLGLKPELLRAVAEKGYTVATPIQTKAIPAVLGYTFYSYRVFRGKVTAESGYH